MDYKLEIIQSIGKIVVFSLVVLSVFLLTVKTKHKLPNRLFGCYLLVIAFDLMGLFLSATALPVWLQNLKTASSLLQLPLFYWYVMAACYANFRLQWLQAWHALPFLFFSLLFWQKGIAGAGLQAYDIVGELQYFAYIISIFIVLKKYKLRFLENYANSAEWLYKWLFQITLFSCIAHSFVLCRWLLRSWEYYSYLPYINLLISLMVLCVLTFFVLKALYQPSLFAVVDMHLTASKDLVLNKPQPTPNDNDKALKKLQQFMATQKPYLEEDITLQKMALALQMPERELSVLINQQLGQHFFDFINTHRIKEAKAMLAAQPKLTVLEVLYAVGFNSKSSFYTAFKKVTGQTPTQFKKGITL